MKRNNKIKKAKVKKVRHRHPLAGEISPEQRRRNSEAHQQAEEDLVDDAEFTAHGKNDDLDEGESARLGEDKTDLI